MSIIDNSELLAVLMGKENDGDTFWYTEILDRKKRSAGDNRKRMVRAFRHGSGLELLELMPAIRSICDATGARAYTRLSPRSHRGVARHLLMLTAEMVTSEQWNSASYLYARACGRCNIQKRRTWLYDVDDANEEVLLFGAELLLRGLLITTVPSRKGFHYIARPHDQRARNGHDQRQITLPTGVSLHQDNPTNLYIPEDA